MEMKANESAKQQREDWEDRRDEYKKAEASIESGMDEALEEEVAAFRPRGIVTTQDRHGERPAMQLTPKAVGVAITFRNFQNQREMLVSVKRKKEAEIEMVKAEMRKLNDTYEKLQRELFVTQAKEEAVRAAIRSMEDRGVHE